MQIVGYSKDVEIPTAPANRTQKKCSSCHPTLRTLATKHGSVESQVKRFTFAQIASEISYFPNY
jgi:hypothetical protein